MTLQQLEYVVALDNHRHFVTAAESCHVTQPTLTMQVKKLEEEIGVKIFDRSKKPMVPTKAGENIVLKARQILREVNQLKALVSDETESLEGEFSLGVIPTVAPYLLPLFLPEFVKSHPRTVLRIQELETDQIITELQKGTLDLGILATPLEVRTIREIPLYQEPFLLYLPESHPWIKEKHLAPQMVSAQQMLLLEEGHCFRDQALSICGSSDRKVEMGFEYESGSIEALKGLVKQGIGYTMVPELSVLGELDSKNIKRFTSPEPAREISIVTHHSFTKEALIEHLRDAILPAVPERFSKAKRFTRVKWR